MNKNKYMGISKVGEKGQIVIPKEVRDIFEHKTGRFSYSTSRREKRNSLSKI